MKKRITINVIPVDNGYTIQATASDHNGQNAKAKNFIAATDAEVTQLITTFVDEAFTPPPNFPAAAST